MALDPTALPETALAFLRERHLATLTTQRADGTPHVVPVGFTYDPTDRIARVITAAGSTKAHNVEIHQRVALCQLDGRRWLTLEGAARVVADDSEVRFAEAAYAERYRTPRERADRVAILIDVDRVLGTV